MFIFIDQMNQVLREKKEEKKDDKGFQWAFSLNRTSLDLIGIWPKAKDDFETNCSLKELRIPMMALWLLCCLFLPQMYALSKVLDQLPLVIDNLITSCAALTSSIKLLLLWSSRKVLGEIMITVMDDWSNVRSWWEVKLMIKQAQRARFFTISGYAIMFICFLGFIATPFFGLSIRIINNVTDPENGRFFPLQTCYPYESAESPYFELTYITQLIAGSFVGIAFSVPDNFFGALVFHACAQCEILKRKMSQLLPNSNDGIVNTMRNEIKFFEFQLRQCVKIHVRLIKLINAIENSFNLLILVQVLCLLVVICCLGFEVIRLVGNTSERPPIVQIFTLAGTLFNLMIHMLVYCIASEILAEYSLGFSQAIYSFSWYLLPKTCSRHIILIMLRSKLPLRLSIGKFFYLSLNTYLNIMKNSIGYISMLLAVNN